ncbi:hypothetical protein DAEQUDRAFT_671551, partial [Daedalea quercina L-15889]
LHLYISSALELMEHNITVNAYAPGLILTDVTTSPQDAKLGGNHGSALKALLEVPQEVPGARPEPIASIVVYLIKPEAYFITGMSSRLNPCNSSEWLT